MLIKKPDDIRPSEITDEKVYKQRRRLLAVLGAGAVGLVLGGAYLERRETSAPSRARAPEGAVRSLPQQRYLNLPQGPFVSSESPTDYQDATSYNNFYELGSGKQKPALNAHELVTRPWSVSVAGECDKPGNYDLEDLLRSQTLEDRIYRAAVRGNLVGGDPWVGFALGNLLKRAEPNSQAKYVELLAIRDEEMLPAQRSGLLEWPYREGLRIDEAMHPLATLAVGMYGRELPNQNGAPLRLVVPWKYGFKSIKSIVAIRFLRAPPVNTWQALQPDEYGFYANVNPAVDHPRWSQASERRLGDWRRRDTESFNGYAEQVAGLYRGMDLSRDY